MLASERFLSIHVRRGDYVGLGDLFGLLGGKYFLDSIQALRSMGCHWSRIVVFSDDVVAARDLLEKSLEGENVSFIEPPEGSDDAESLVLMSLAAHHIISNSTFSLWAALLGKSNAQVVAPEPWSKGLSEPREMLPSEWLRIDANFL